MTLFSFIKLQPSLPFSQVTKRGNHIASMTKSKTELDRPYLPIEASFSTKVPENPIQSGDSDSISAEVVFSTINVLSLDPEEMRSKRSCGLVETGRMLLLQRSLADIGIHFCGAQETRTQGPEIIEMERYIAISSGSTPDGTHGCEFWGGGAKDVPIIVNGNEVFITSKCLSVYFAEPTILIVAVSV